MTTGGNWMSRFLKFGLFIVLIFSLLTYVVMGLWNWLLPDLIGASTIGFWQAAGLLLLSKILFGGWRNKSSYWRGSWGGHWQAKNSGHWRDKMKEKWENMSDEEREQFKSKMKRYCPGSWKPQEEFKSTEESASSSS